MKKSLLVIAMMAAGVAAQAQFVEPLAMPGYSWQGISPDGKYVVSELYGTLSIINLETYEEFLYEEDWATGASYSGGLGNYLSATGIILGSTTSDGNACYWKDGEWFELYSEGTTDCNLANGITPDGSRICGSVSQAPFSVDAKVIMQVPCYWDATEDGYGEYHVLPHPETDFSGRIPQYITALYISEDGKTIAGQVRDYTGFCVYPILYTQNADGEWSYSLPNIEAFCPEGTVFPEVPGEQPKRPQETDYMTEEELAAYQAAYDEWVASWYQGEYPEYTSFMSDEEIAAFNAAYEEYQALYEAWAEKNEAFKDVYYEVLATAPSYEFNNVYLTPCGSKYLTTSATEVETDDPNSWFPWVTVYAPTVIDLTTGVATDIETGGVDMMVFDVPNEDVIMLTNGLSADIPAGWIYKDGVATSLVDYFKSFGEEASAWVDENLFYEIPLGYDFDNPILDEEGNIVDYPVLSTETYVSGLCCATPDLKWMAMWIYNSFDWESDYMTFSWIINADEMSGVKDVINVGNGNVTFDAAGNLVATGDINAVSVYDLQGRRVLDTTATGTVANQLPAGVYVVRATGDNTTITAKLRK